VHHELSIDINHTHLKWSEIEFITNAAETNSQTILSDQCIETVLISSGTLKTTLSKNCTDKHIQNDLPDR
jgi:hypothetical protein